MAISINPSVPVVGAQAVGSATDGVVLQPGTVVSAQVQNVLAENLVRIAIANLSLDVLTEVALTPGQNLQLSVSQTQDGVVRLQIVGQGAGAAASDAASVAPSLATNLAPNLAPNAPVGPAANVATPNDPLTPLERIAVSVAAESAATTQQSLAPLFANLNVASSADLPPALQQAITDVLARQTSLDQNLGGGDIQNAFQKSGLFLEASLASGNATDFRTRINAVRAVDALPAWDGTTPPARDMLIHERRVNLFLQTRRLHDMYRFGLKADRWLPNSVAALKACFFPITAIERQSNPLAPQPTNARSASCSQ